MISVVPSPISNGVPCFHLTHKERVECKIRRCVRPIVCENRISVGVAWRHLRMRECVKVPSYQYTHQVLICFSAHRIPGFRLEVSCSSESYPKDRFLGRLGAVSSKYTFCDHSVHSCATESQFKRSCAPHCVRIATQLHHKFSAIGYMG